MKIGILYDQILISLSSLSSFLSLARTYLIAVPPISQERQNVFHPLDSINGSSCLEYAISLPHPSAPSHQMPQLSCDIILVGNHPKLFSPLLYSMSCVFQFPCYISYYVVFKMVRLHV